MQDKIQEIMGLVDAYYKSGAQEGLLLRSNIQSKLRELVREPLSDEEIADYVEHADVHGRYADPFERGVRWGIRHYERAHGITNTSGVE